MPPEKKPIKNEMKSEVLRALIANQDSLTAALTAIRHYCTPGTGKETLQMAALWEAIAKMLGTQRLLLEALEKYTL